MSGGLGIAEWLWGDYRRIGYWWTPSIGRGHLSIRVLWWPFTRNEDEAWRPDWPLVIHWIPVSKRPTRRVRPTPTEGVTAPRRSETNE